MITLTEELGRLIKDISHRRQEIKEQFIKTWLAANLPEGMEKLEEQVEWIVNNCSIQENWSDDMKTVTWQIARKFKVVE